MLKKKKKKKKLAKIDFLQVKSSTIVDVSVDSVVSFSRIRLKCPYVLHWHPSKNHWILVVVVVY